MAKKRGTNFPNGIAVDIDGRGGLGAERLLPGTRSVLTMSGLAAASAGQVLFIVPTDCKLVQVLERHVTKAGQAGTIQIEKVPSGTAPGSGTVLLDAALDATTNNNTVQTATATNAVLAAGDALAIKLASGALTSLAGMTLAAVIEWTA